MATSQETIDYLLDQLEAARQTRARKMFGEYALYCDDKVVGLVCDDQLYLKITAPGKDFVGDGYEEGHAYPGAKPSMLITADLFDDPDWLSSLVRLTADALPPPKPRRPRSKKKKAR
jgi:DNA transformation protein